MKGVNIAQLPAIWSLLVSNCPRVTSYEVRKRSKTEKYRNGGETGNDPRGEKE